MKNYKTKYSTNRTVKDALFRYIFGQEENKKWLLQLYNALEGTNYEDPNLITITTIENVIYMGIKNDVSFLIGSDMTLLEEQSTYNPNMPIRGFLYFAKLYEKFIESNKINLYSTKLQKLPKPRFVVFYLGPKQTPDKTILKLSDSFENVTENEKQMFQWSAAMININNGHNTNLVESCKPLYDYTRFIDWIKIKTTMKIPFNLAVDEAVNCAIEENLLEGFFKSHKAEVVGMVLEEFDEELYREDLKKELYEEAKKDLYEEAKKEISEKTAAALLKMSLTPEQIATATGLSIEEIELLKDKKTAAE